MRYEIETGGRMRAVFVTRVGAGFAVTVDQRTWSVDAVRIDGQTLSLIVDANPGKQASEVTVVPEPSTGQLTVHVGTTPVVVTVNGRRHWGRKDDSAGTGAGPQRVLAPMPGKIVRLLVKTGDTVSARQPLVVVEAMKMENELRAGRAGTIAEVHAREGASVEAGALLILIQ